MINLSPDICRRIRDARKAAKLSQSELAGEVGCKQSALSMFEQGDGTKLNEAVVTALAKRFNIDIDAKVENVGATEVRNIASHAVGSGFCPNPSCPTNESYEIEGRIYRKPNRLEADPAGGRYCAMCGEVLERTCPNCTAPVHAGAICSLCGEPYIPS